MSAFGRVVSLIIEGAEKTAERKGKKELADALHDSGIIAGEADAAFIDKHPVEATVGLVAAVALSAVFAPEIAAVSVVSEGVAGEVLGGILGHFFKKEAASIIVGVTNDLLISSGLDLYTEATTHNLFQIGDILLQNLSINSHEQMPKLYNNDQGQNVFNTIKIGDEDIATSTNSSDSGALTAKFKIINDPNGNSRLFEFHDDGSTLIKTYNSHDIGNGSVIKKDIENADGTSSITTFDNAGNPTTLNYTGRHGTGSIVGTHPNPTVSSVKFHYQGNSFSAPIDGASFISGVVTADVDVENYREDFSGIVGNIDNGVDPYIKGWDINAIGVNYYYPVDKNEPNMPNEPIEFDLDHGKVAYWGFNSALSATDFVIGSHYHQNPGVSEPNEDFAESFHNLISGASSKVGIWTKL